MVKVEEEIPAVFVLYINPEKSTAAKLYLEKHYNELVSKCREVFSHPSIVKFLKRQALFPIDIKFELEVDINNINCRAVFIEKDGEKHFVITVKDMTIRDLMDIWREVGDPDAIGLVVYNLSTKSNIQSPKKLLSNIEEGLYLGVYRMDVTHDLKDVKEYLMRVI